jgi:hypothetical protein
LTSDIEKATTDSSYDPDQWIYGTRKSMGIDPAWGSSAFGIVITRFVDGKIQVLYADQFERPDFIEMIKGMGAIYEIPVRWIRT